MAWRTIAATERDEDSPITQELLGAYFQRDDALMWRQAGHADQPQAFVRTTNPETWVLLNHRLWVPDWAKGVKARFKIDGDWTGTLTEATVDPQILYGIGLFGLPISLGVHDYEVRFHVDTLTNQVSGIRISTTLEVSGTIGTQSIHLDRVYGIWFTDNEFTSSDTGWSKL